MKQENTTANCGVRFPVPKPFCRIMRGYVPPEPEPKPEPDDACRVQAPPSCESHDAPGDARSATDGNCAPNALEQGPGNSARGDAAGRADRTS